MPSPFLAFFAAGTTSFSTGSTLLFFTALGDSAGSFAVVTDDCDTTLVERRVGSVTSFFFGGIVFISLNEVLGGRTFVFLWEMAFEGEGKPLLSCFSRENWAEIKTRLPLENSTPTFNLDHNKFPISNFEG
jgi:hypothetical protein